MLKTLLLFFITALAEIVGCYSAYYWLRKEANLSWLLLSIISLCLFVWLLSLHPAASGRVYAAYGGLYVATSLLWLRLVDGIALSHYDYTGAGFMAIGTVIIILGW